MKRLKRAVALIACMLITFSGCGDADTNSHPINAKEDVNKNAQIVEFDAVTEICSNDNLILQYDPIETKLDILDKNSGAKLWSTGVTEAEYGTEIKNKLTAKALKQIINLKYTDFEKKSDVINNLSDMCKTVFREIDNGLRMDFVFSRLGISFSLDFVLNDNGVSVTLPQKSIIEEGKYGITSIDILPMITATKGGSEGYFLVPDGSGALYRFDGYASSNSVLTLDIYDDMLKSLDSKDDKTKNGVQKVCAPVFGVSHLSKGLFANITEGAENCSITLQTDKSVYAVNRIFPVLNLRKQYFMKTGTGDEVSNYEKTTLAGDLNIEYTVLNSSQCGYSEMAGIYREWLVKQKLLNKTENVNNFTAAVDFLVSVEKSSMLSNTSLVTASFEDIDKIIKDLNKEGVTNISSILYGWQQNGYYSYPGSSKVSSAAGGKKALENLIKDNKNTNFYLLQNYLKANIDVGGFSKYSDVVYKIDNIPLTDESEKLFLLNPTTQLKRFSKDIKTATNSDAGIAFEGFGSMLYEDYESRARMSRTDFTNEIGSYLKKSNEASVASAVDGFAPYTLKYADMIFNLPDRSSEYLHLDEAVPFLQMVLHGYVNYSAQTPGNLSNDIVNTKLKWVEYGYMPTFMLTYENSDRLEDSSFSLLFSSDYGTWGEKVAEIYNELKGDLELLSGETIKTHEKQNGVAKITYSNGAKIIVNYTAEPVTVDDVTVDGNSYKVIK